MTVKSSESGFKNYDHVVEAGIELKSGLLEVVTCPVNTIVLSIKLKPGKYKARIYSSNLANTVRDEDEGNDHYKIEIWPDDTMERTVLKRYLML